MAKRQRRRSISLTERHYVLLTKLAGHLERSGSSTAETAIELLAAHRGVEVTDADVLDYRAGRARTPAPNAQPEAEQTAEEVASGYFSF